MCGKGAWVTPRPDLSGNPDFWKSEIRAIPDFRNSELAKLFYTGNDQTSITQVLLGLFQHGFLQCLLCLVHYLHNIIVGCKYWFIYDGLICSFHKLYKLIEKIRTWTPSAHSRYSAWNRIVTQALMDRFSFCFRFSTNQNHFCHVSKGHMNR